MNCVKIIRKLCMICICSKILLNSGNFLETAWRLIHFCIYCCVSGCSAWRWIPIPSGDSKPVTILGISAWSAWQDWLWSLGDAGSIFNLGFPVRFGVSCLERKQRVGLRRWCGVKMLWFLVWLRVEFDGTMIRRFRVG